MKKFYIRIIMAVLTVFAIIITTTSVYAWRTYTSDVKNIGLQVTRIDSEIYVYQGIDVNYNGIPDLLSNYSESEIASMNTGHPASKREYYEENKAFKYLGHQFAVSYDVTDEEKVPYSITGMFPTMVSTLKLSVINNSDGTNWVSFSFDSKNYTADELKLLSCLSVRAGRVINSSGDITSSDVSVDFSKKYYFNDSISSNFTGLNVINDDTALEVKGLVNRNTTINDDIVDIWFQFEMEAYDDLIAHSDIDGANEFSLSYEEYNNLQNKQINLPDLKVLLEVRA